MKHLYLTPPLYLEERHGVEPSTEDVVQMVCHHFKANKDDVMSKCRKREYVLPRQIAHYLLKKYTNKSLSVIGREVGGKNHATVIHGVKNISSLSTVDKMINNDVVMLERKISNRFNLLKEMPYFNTNDDTNMLMDDILDVKFMAHKSFTVEEICSKFNISQSTLYNIKTTKF